MGILDWLGVKRSPQPPSEDLDFLFIHLPGRIEPMQRGEQFEDPLSERLSEARLGAISGGGSELRDEDEEGRRFVTAAGIDVDTTDGEAARALLREHLPKLGCPAGTEIQFEQPRGVALRDVFDGHEWSLGLARAD